MHEFNIRLFVQAVVPGSNSDSATIGYLEPDTDYVIRVVAMTNESLTIPVTSVEKVDETEFPGRLDRILRLIPGLMCLIVNWSKDWNTFLDLFVETPSHELCFPFHFQEIVTILYKLLISKSVSI